MTYNTKFYRPSFTRADGGTMPNDTGWQTRHLNALTVPNATERAIVGMFSAWATYADTHKARYESGIGEDGVLGTAWATIGVNLRNLLNGECGRLDCGTLDGFVCDTLAAEGFDPDTMERRQV